MRGVADKMPGGCDRVAALKIHNSESSKTDMTIFVSQVAKFAKEQNLSVRPWDRKLSINYFLSIITI